MLLLAKIHSVELLDDENLFVLFNLFIFIRKSLILYVIIMKKKQKYIFL